MKAVLCKANGPAEDLVMEEVEITVDPADVELSVEKQGYEVVRRLDRSRARQKSGVFEIDFWMAPSE